MERAEEKVVQDTKQAWGENWHEHSVEDIMQTFEYTRVKRLLDIFTSIIPKKGRVLEGGCGLGPWVIKMSSLGYDMHGVDYDAVSVSKIKKYDNTLKVYAADIEKMPFDNDFFSSYISIGVLEHFSYGPEKAIQEAWRVLEPNGIFLVLVPYMNFPVMLKYPFAQLKKNRFIRKLMGKKEKVFYYERYFGRNEMKKILENNGFTVERISPVDNIFSFVQLLGIFRDKSTFDGENALAVKTADFFSRFMPWGTAWSTMVVARKKARA